MLAVTYPRASALLDTKTETVGSPEVLIDTSRSLTDWKSVSLEMRNPSAFLKAMSDDLKYVRPLPATTRSLEPSALKTGAILVAPFDLSVVLCHTQARDLPFGQFRDVSLSLSTAVNLIERLP